MTAPFEPGWEALLGPTLPVMGLWVLVRRRGISALALLVGMMACIGVGEVAGKVRSGLVATSILKEQIGPVRIEGVVAVINACERSRRVRIDVHAIERLSPEQTTKFV